MDHQYDNNIRSQNGLQTPLDFPIRHNQRIPQRNNRNQPVVPQVSRTQNILQYSGDSSKRNVQFDDRTLENYV